MYLFFHIKPSAETCIDAVCNISLMLWTESLAIKDRDIQEKLN